MAATPNSETASMTALDTALTVATPTAIVTAFLFGWFIKLLYGQHKVEKDMRAEIAALDKRLAIAEQAQVQHSQAISQIDRRVEDLGLTLGEVKMQVAETNAGTRLLKQGLDSHIEQSRRNHDETRETLTQIRAAVDRRRPEVSNG